MKEEQTESFTLLLADYCDLVDKIAQLTENSKEWKRIYDIVDKESTRMIETARTIQGGQCKTK